MITTEGNHCWVCGFWTYTLVFWTEQIGKQNEANNIGIDEAEKTRVIKQLKDVNKDYYMNKPKRPMLFSDSTNWQGKSFMKVVEFLQILDANARPDFDA